MAGVAAVGLIAGAILLLLHDRVLIAVLLLLAAAWIVAGMVTELRAPRCPSCGETFCRRCEAVGGATEA